MLMSFRDRDAPLVTVIVAVKNGAETIQRCIDSFREQSLQEKELIVMDGGSVDGTVQLLEANDGDITHWESAPDWGIYNAWNKALKYARGNWICFLGADDHLWDSNVLDVVVRYGAEAEKRGVLIVYGEVMLVSGRGKPVERRGVPWEYGRESFRTKKMTIANPGCFYYRDFFDIHGEFDESFVIGADYEMLLRELKTGEALFMPGVIVSVMETCGLSNAPASQFLILKEEMRARKLHGLHKVDTFLVIQYWALVFARIVTSLFGEKTSRLLLDGYRLCVGKPRRWVD